MNIIDGKKIQNEILEKVKSEVAKLSFQPIFCDILVGDDPASEQYVRMKAKKAESVGIKFHNANFPAAITTEELVEEIKKINAIENMCGIIVQLPLPPHLDRRAVLDAIDPKLDVDCLGAERSKKFYGGDMSLVFPTALACVTLLDTLNVELKDKKIVIVGQGELVGKPTTALLKFRGLNPVAVDIYTPPEEREKIIKEADVIISGVGKGKLITGEKIKQGAIIIDAGTSEGDGGIVGDVDLESVKDVASFVSPVPGGVGPVTVAVLLENVLKVAKTK